MIKNLIETTDEHRLTQVRIYFRIFFFLFCVHLCLSVVAFILPAEASASQNYLQNLKVYKNSDELRVVMDFSSAIKAEPIPSFYEKSIQFDMPYTYIHPAKRVFEVGDEFLKYVYALQHSKDKVRMRLLVAQSGLSLKDRLSVQRDDKNLIIIIKKLPAASQQLQAASLPVQTGRQSPVDSQRTEIKSLVEELPSVIGNNANAQEIKSVADKKDEGLNAETQSQNSEIQTPKSDYLKYQEPLPVEPPDMSSAVIKTIAALAIVLAAVLFISYIAKKLLKKNDIVFGKDKLIRVLGTSYIGVKKAITLLDVAGEVLVIGVTNNSITMLTKLESEEARSKLLNTSYQSPVTSHQLLNNKDEMVAQIAKTIKERVLKLKRI
jgi:flagellar protein FliO/FliZ